jgi:hypothetical protein
MVKKHSAMLEFPHEEVVCLERDHFSMCKFEANDPEFEMVWTAIQKASQGPIA